MESCRNGQRSARRRKTSDQESAKTTAMNHTRLALLALTPMAYLAGSIPFGLLVGLAKGIDVRKAGSGNIGATNVARLLGGRFFALVFTLDLLKGLLPVLTAAWLLHGQAKLAADYALWLLVAFAAVAGHMFSIFLRFKGGKGVATSTGVILGVFPYFTFAGLIAAAVAMAAFFATRYVSVMSMLGAICFPIAYLSIALIKGWDPLGRQLPLLLFAVLICALIVYKHRTNIARLRAGTENRVGSRATSEAVQQGTNETQ
jgi:glycerol-3-phosphate acyltransferase PlsY